MPNQKRTADQIAFFVESTPVDTNFGKVAVITYPDFGDLFKCRSATQNI